MKKLFLYIFFLFSLSSYAQNDSCDLRISILTCAPGDELYSLFGHSAIRVVNEVNNIDIVFNYGTFNFEEPGFYTKFVRGKLNYCLAADNYLHFLRTYEYEERSVTAQELQLSCKEKHDLYIALQKNLQEENRYYKYDFLFDNCTSRIRDLLYTHIPNISILQTITPSNTTFRNLLYQYLDKGGQPWSKLGIDVLLGAKLDRTIPIHEAMFLPDYLMYGVDNMKYNNGQTLVKEKYSLYNASPNTPRQATYIPLIVFSVITIIALSISLLKYKWACMISNTFDSLLLYTTGLLGCLLLFMWFGTDHVTCSNNYNLLWALPTNFIAAFFIWRRPLWVRRYFLAVSIIAVLLLACWWFIPQQLNIALIPFVLLLGIRCFKLSR